MSKLFTSEELREHNKADDLWIAVRGTVYNVTDFHDHPGKLAPLMHFAGSDATPGFDKVHPNVDIMSMLKESNIMGKFVNTDKMAQDIIDNIRSTTDDNVLATVINKIADLVVGVPKEAEKEAEKSAEVV